MSLQEKAFAAKKSGQVAGPNQATFAGNTIFIEDAGSDVEAGDWYQDPNPAMDHYRPGGSYKALGALQPHRQSRQLGPLGGRIALHQRRIEASAGLRAPPARPFGNCRVGSRCAR